MLPCALSPFRLFVSVVLLSVSSAMAQDGEGPSPANDECSQAVVVVMGQTRGTLAGAMTDGSASVGLPGQPDVWYHFQAALDGDPVVTTCGSNDTGGVDAGIDAVLSFHTACPGTTANESAANDDDSGGYCGAADQGAQRDAVLGLRVASGQTVWFRVSRYSDSNAENFELGVSFHAIPGSDFCSGALPITDTSSRAARLRQALPLPHKFF